jgi:putative superfamily III holin-X
MQEDNNPFERLTENLKEYVNTRYDLITLKITQKVANMSAKSIAFLIIATVVSLFFFFINMALAYYISSLFGNNYTGFFIVSGFYLVVTIIFLIGRKNLLINPLRNCIINKILTDEQD